MATNMLNSNHSILMSNNKFQIQQVISNIVYYIMHSNLKEMRLLKYCTERVYKFEEERTKTMVQMVIIRTSNVRDSFVNSRAPSDNQCFVMKVVTRLIAS